EDAGEDLRDLGLSDAGVSLDEQRPAHLASEVNRRRDLRLGDVALALHRLLERADLGRHAAPPGPLPAPAAEAQRAGSARNCWRQPAQQKYQVRAPVWAV